MVATREQLCETIHQEIDRLPVFKTKSTSISTVPKDGIYFWYEDGEMRMGNRGQRVTRVGINERPGRLHGRIKEHYGQNREGSTFRKHLGGALLAKDGEPESEIKEWYRARRSARFKDSKFCKYEGLVTQQAELGSYRVLRVTSISEREELEERLIAIFSHCSHCSPSDSWLGTHAYRNEIRLSGLWNVEYVCSTNEFQNQDLLRLRKRVRLAR